MTEYKFVYMTPGNPCMFVNATVQAVAQQVAEAFGEDYASVSIPEHDATVVFGLNQTGPVNLCAEFILRSRLVTTESRIRGPVFVSGRGPDGEVQSISQMLEDTLRERDEALYDVTRGDNR